MFKLAPLFALLAVASCEPQFFNPYQTVSPFQAPIVPVTAAPFIPAVIRTATVAPVVPLARYAATAESVAPILRQDQDVNVDGSYRYAYETGNGIAAEQVGGLKAIDNSAGNVAQGSYRYTSPEGQVVSISYVADENGYRAVGDAIPTPPPLPPAIARSLEYIAAHPQTVQQVQYVQQPQYVQQYYQ